jgi:hypothetical protein
MNKRKIYLRLFLLGVIAAMTHGYAMGQSQSKDEMCLDTAYVKVYFHQGKSTLEPSFRENSINIMKFARKVEEMRKNPRREIISINIVSGASPEGNSLLNKELSRKRATAISEYMRGVLYFYYPMAEISPKGVDWTGLTKMVSESNMPYKDEALFILKYTPEWISRNGKVVDGRKHQLQTIYGGQVWWYMYDTFFPDLRYSALRVIYKLPVEEKQQIVTKTDTVIVKAKPDTVIVKAKPDTVILSKTDTVTHIKVEKDTVYLKQPVEKKPFYMAFKTNMLYDAVLVPNVGAEFYLGNGWSIGGNWAYAWWKTDKKHYYWRIYGGELDFRRYFGERAKKKPLTGQHIGIYGHMFTYDFELGGTGYLSKLTYGGGIEYGYSLPIGRRLNIDFGIGIGYLGGKYQVYDPIDECYVWREDRRMNWFEPTKAEISLIWLIGRGNYNERKGGEK